MTTGTPPEELELERLYRKAVDGKESLLVWAGGDAKSQSQMYTTAFRKRSPEVPIEAVVELSKYHDATLEHRLLTGDPIPDVIHLQSLQDFDNWKTEGGIVRRYTNTSPHGFREFMRDRARVERLRGLYENFIGPVVGPNPNTLEM